MYPEMHTTEIPNAGWDRRIRLFHLRRLVTSFVIESERYVVVLDTLINPQTATELLNFVQPALNGRQLLVINTHADWDHCWGNSIFAGPHALHPAPIIAHKICRERVWSDESRAELAEMQQQSPRTFDDVQLQPPTITFDGECTIDGGDLTFVLAHTPGHQPDHVSVWLPELRTVFAGDAAEMPLPYVTNPFTLPELRASLAKLRALDATTALYCHARGHYTTDVIHNNIAYFDTLERQVRAALDAGRLPDQLDDSTDIATLIDFPFERVPGYEALDVDEQQAYRSTHQLAARAMASYVRTKR